MTSLRKHHILQPEDSSPKGDSNPRSSTGGRLGKQTCYPLHHTSPESIAPPLGKKIRVTDVAEYVTSVKWKWAGHISRINDNRQPVRSTEWQIKYVRSVGRPKRRWRGDTVGQQGTTLTKTAKD